MKRLWKPGNNGIYSDWSPLCLQQAGLQGRENTAHAGGMIVGADSIMEESPDRRQNGSGQRWYTQLPIGANEGSQFPNDEISVDQFFRQMTPDTGMTSDIGTDFDTEMVAKAMAATIDKVYEKTGKDSMLVPHSQGGRAGWPTAKYTDHIAAIVAVEPGGAPEVDSEDYNTVTEKNIPIVFYFGDYIDNGDPAIQATAAWQGMRQTL